jgi:hypothetical protein
MPLMLPTLKLRSVKSANAPPLPKCELPQSTEPPPPMIELPRLLELAPPALPELLLLCTRARLDDGAPTGQSCVPSRKFSCG